MIPAYPPDKEAIHRAAEAIRRGEVVVYPTETLYGLGADATSAESVKRVLEIKRRPADMPISIIAADMDMVNEAVEGISEKAGALIKEFWPGPLTLILKASPALPDELSAGTGNIGIRVPSSEIARKLSELSGVPITATSANISGEGDPSDPAIIESDLSSGPALFLDAGKLESGPGSTVVDVTGSSPLIIREGVIPSTKIFALWG